MRQSDDACSGRRVSISGPASTLTNSRAYEADWQALGQLPNSTSRATGPKWIAAAIAIATNQVSVICQPGNQLTMTSP
jgi:hypothetical protein